jgi:hypothetical protein
MPSKHTKGPWTIDSGEGHTHTINNVALKRTIANVTAYKSIDIDSDFEKSALANARLIASAPELLMCCEATLSYLMFEPHLDKEQLQKFIKETVAKARGES